MPIGGLSRHAVPMSLKPDFFAAPAASLLGGNTINFFSVFSFFT
jgi:hypothetical protein